MADDILKKLKPEDVDALMQSNFIAPATAERLRSSIPENMTPREDINLAQDTIENPATQMIESVEPNMSKVRPVKRPDYVGGNYSENQNKYGIEEGAIRDNIQRNLKNMDEEDLTSAVDSINRIRSSNEKINQWKIQQAEKKYNEEVEKVNKYNKAATTLGVPQRPLPTREQFNLPPTPQELEQQRVKEEEAALQMQAKAKAEEERIMAEQREASEIKRQQDRLQEQRRTENKKNEMIENARKNIKNPTDKDAIPDSTPKKTGNPYIDSPFMTALAVGLGQFAAGAGNENPVLKIINSRIQAINEDRKLTQQEKDAKASAELDLAKLKISKAAQRTDDFNARMNAMKIMEEIAVKRAELDRNLQFSLQGPLKGITADELALIEDDKLRERYVPVTVTDENGNELTKFYPVSNREVAQKLILESIPNAKNAQTALKRMIELNKQAGFTSKLLPDSFTEQGREARQLQQQIIGNMRLDFFGPGVLTEQEQQLARRIIASPTSLYSLIDEKGNEQLIRNILAKAQFGNKERLKAAGVAIPESTQDKNIAKTMQFLKSKNMPASKGDAINFLIRNNRWQDEGI